MKSKHLFALAFVPLLLASCGKKGYVGVYSFQLGKASGAHATATMTLRDDAYYDKTTLMGKQMTLFGQMQTAPASESSSGSSASSVAEQGSFSYDEEGGGLISDIFGEMLKKGLTIPGYYNIGADREQGRKRLSFGFDFASILGEDVGLDIPPLDPEVIEQFVYCEIDTRSVYLQIPVSFTDLALQLYWYGTDLSWIADLDDGFGNFLRGFAQLNSSDSSSSSSSQASSATGLSSLPEEVIVPHEPGTKPTKEDIDKINETYPLYHDGKKFRTFYTLSLSLSRQ